LTPDAALGRIIVPRGAIAAAGTLSIAAAAAPGITSSSCATYRGASRERGDGLRRLQMKTAADTTA